jgi:tetratricopeptide (TPR) repeat protein
MFNEKIVNILILLCCSSVICGQSFKGDIDTLNKKQQNNGIQTQAAFPEEKSFSFLVLDSASNLFDKALHFESVGDWLGALIALDAAINMNPKPVYHNYRGLIHAYLRDMPKAFNDLNRAIELDPNYAMAHFNKAMAYFHENDNRNACKEMREALRCNMADAGVFLKEYCE